ncbi:MAG: Holliday junction branch migration protein RuvA [Gammaproteobacteria bacterium]|nr:Holliday junction branch migration protein RuvA [Gammaproteobacteria bacterium]
MIGWLSGSLRAKHPPVLLLDVQGVGYEVEVPMTTFYDLPAVGEKLVLHIHHVVREDAQMLYGFLRELDRGLFRLLIKVNGVGPKLALAILSGMNAAEFSQCIQIGDSAALTRLPGIGKRTAERLIIEMRDRLDGGEATGADVSTAPSGAALEDPRAEAVNALVALGYKPLDASKKVRAVAEAGMACEEIIRRALRSFG